ncbi:MAG: methionyl-tRNA formyltransferase [Gammaproteobacteria bacterium]|nr:methionyl-tRNA formyltransferase [Gammaproteobacteria bacterium]MCY4274674.1 methionyl-tRNA formyltransferase [Gammaproteobacteria bacterium]
MRVVFAGTPDFAVPSLKALLKSSLVNLVAVYCQPDRPSGRGRKILPGPVKSTAINAGIPVLQPAKINSLEAITQFQSLQPDLMIVVAYGALLKKQHLDIPNFGCFNLHASLLPRWRGAAPIQRAIEAGDSTSGVSLMRIVEELDAGPVLAQSKITLKKNATGGWLHDQLAKMAADLLSENLLVLTSQKLKEQPQNISHVTYASKLSKAESWLNWTDHAEQIERRIRAFDPWPGSMIRIDGKTLKILQASTIFHPGSNTPGQILKVDQNGIIVQSGLGAIQIEKLQKSGGKVMRVAEYLHGHSVRTGMLLDTANLAREIG